MNVYILESSPNQDDLTAACAAATASGIVQAGGQAECIRINDLDIRKCQACDNGWDACLTEHGCQMKDDFQALHQRIIQADALTDRLRRCEATRSPASYLTGKPYIAAAAGGGGGGMITCLASMERWGQHVRAQLFDLLPVNRWSRPYKLDAIQAAARTMVESKRTD